MYLQCLIYTPRGIVSVYALFERCFIRGTVYVLYERVVYVLRGTVYVMYQRYSVGTVREGLCTY